MPPSLRSAEPYLNFLSLAVKVPVHSPKSALAGSLWSSRKRLRQHLDASHYETISLQTSCTCLPSFSHPDYFPSALRTEQIGLVSGQSPVVSTQNLKNLNASREDHPSEIRPIQLQNGLDKFHKYHGLLSYISEDMRRSLFRQPPIQMAGSWDKNIICRDISGRHFFKACMRQLKV